MPNEAVADADGVAPHRGLVQPANDDEPSRPPPSQELLALVDDLADLAAQLYLEMLAKTRKP